MNAGGLLMLAVAGVALWLLFRQKRKVEFKVRVKPPVSHTLQNLIVLAVVIGLAWFVWYVKGTHCNGGC